jgi:hypothetical protein
MKPFVLNQIIAVSPAGSPTLAGVNLRVIAVQKFGPETVGRMAVCQICEDPDDGIVALGFLQTDEAPVATLDLRCGAASIVLAADGSIRLSGTDVVLESAGRLKADAALVELN